MRKFLMGLVVALITTGLMFTATAVSAAPTPGKADSTTNTVAAKQAATKKPKVKWGCKKTPKSFTKNGVTVLRLKTCFNVTLLKKMGCDTEAGKVETPAPPRDPRSECKGKLGVHFKIKMKTPKPPKGYLCGEAMVSLTITQRMKAHGLSISIANGRVNTWARTHLQLKDKIRGWVKNNCVKIPNTEVPPTTPPTYEAPAVDVTPVGCVYPGQTRDVTVTVHNPNDKDDTAKVTYRGNVYIKPVKARGQTTFTFPNQGVGSWSGTALLMTANKSASFTVTVEACPPPQQPTCESEYGPGYTGTYPNCFKDGTTTPPPPADAPGPNPPPADPGVNSKCYSEETGRPVSPNPDGTCPPGSFGG